MGERLVRWAITTVTSFPLLHSRYLAGSLLLRFSHRAFYVLRLDLVCFLAMMLRNGFLLDTTFTAARSGSTLYPGIGEHCFGEFLMMLML